MAYGVKYRFQCESYNGVTYRVDLLEDGYSGAVTTRPLGRAPVLRMQDADPFRSTSCDLVLECQSDGEYVDLYTTDPFHFMVDVQSVDGNGVWNLWKGYVPTEIYSEPDIAPPYDVKITATDGIGILKEYTFEAVGARSIRAHICALLERTGDNSPMFYYATRLSKFQGTEVAFMDEALINLDYMAGESCYDVLKYILVSLRSVIMYRGTHWLIVREVDVQMSSDGMLTAVQCITADPYYVPYSTTVKAGMTVGQMGVADMWPVGFLTRRVVPAKKAVTVRAPWNYMSGFPKVSNNGWSVDGYASFDSANKLYHIGTRTQSFATGLGNVYNSKVLGSMNDNIKIRVKVSAHSVSGTTVEVGHYVQLAVRWAQLGSGGTDYYWSADYGWVTDSGALGDKVTVEETNNDHDPNACKVVEFVIPSAPENGNGGLFRVRIDGSLVDIYDIEVVPSSVAGYEDHIFIDNGSRGEAPTIDITGGRLMASNYMSLDFLRGVFFSSETEGGITTTEPIFQFSDLMNIGKDFMSLAALAYAREVAAPRIEITGKLNNKYVPTIGMPVPFIKSHGVWSLMKSYDWDLVTEDVSFSAVSLPAVGITVEDEVITSIAPEGGISGGSSSSGGGGSPYTLPIASASTLGGVKVGSGLSINSSTGVLSATGGGGGTPYVLPIASANTLGGVKVGTGLSIDPSTGVLSSDGGGGGGTVYPLTLAEGEFTGGEYNPGSAAKSFNIPTTLDHVADGTTRSLANYMPLTGGMMTGDLETHGANLVPHVAGEDNVGTPLKRFGGFYGEDANISGDLTLASTTHVDFGPLRIEYDDTNKALHITKASPSDNTQYGLFVDGHGVVKSVVCANDQEYLGIYPKDFATFYFIGDPVRRVYLGTILIYSET